MASIYVDIISAEQPLPDPLSQLDSNPPGLENQFTDIGHSTMDRKDQTVPDVSFIRRLRIAMYTVYL